MHLKLAALITVLLTAAPALAAKPKPAPSGKSAVAKARLKIKGMDCPGCAGGIVNQLLRLKGVKTAKVDAKTKLGTVDYDPKQVKPADLVKRVKVAGFQAEIVK